MGKWKDAYKDTGKALTEARDEIDRLKADNRHLIKAVHCALQKLDGSDASAVVLMTGYTREELDELGGLDEGLKVADETFDWEQML